MDINERLTQLEYKAKLFHLMISNMENYKFYFYSFVIDHNITEYQTSLILNSLRIMKDRLTIRSVSDVNETLFSDKEELVSLMNHSKPSYKEFEHFIHTAIDHKINAVHLLKSIKLQEINIAICDYLLADFNNN